MVCSRSPTFRVFHVKQLSPSPLLDESLSAALQALAKRGLLRQPRAALPPLGSELSYEGQRVLNMCSNNYLGLANHPELLRAAAELLDSMGLAAGASPLVSGTFAPHRQAEANLARWLAQGDALLFSSGYAANVGALSALAEAEDVIFSDALNHASLIDGARLSRAKVFVYRHNDASHLEALLKEERTRFRRAFVVSDAVFSMDGDLAPLPFLRRLCDAHQASLYIDEAHALGVFGPQGAGLCAAEGIEADILSGTFGKSLGLQGAFVAASPVVVEWLRQRARSYVYSTAGAPLFAALLDTSLALLRGADLRRQRLFAAAQTLQRGLLDLGFELGPTRSPILPVLVGDAEKTMRWSAQLFQQGVFVQGIRPPTVPAGSSRLRLVPTAEHSDEDLQRTLQAFAALER